MYVPAELLQLLEERKDARARKDWARADQIRQEITDKGYIIEDTPLGARTCKEGMTMGKNSQIVSLTAQGVRLAESLLD